MDLPAKAKKVARAVIKNVAAGSVVERALKQAINSKANAQLHPAEVAETIHDAVKDAVKTAVVEAVQDIAEHSNGETTSHEEHKGRRAKKKSAKTARKPGQK